MKRRRKVTSHWSDGNHADLLDGLRSLGLTTVTAPQVTAAMKDLFPKGVMEMEHGEVLRAVFLHLKRQNSGR